MIRADLAKEASTNASLGAPRVFAAAFSWLSLKAFLPRGRSALRRQRVDRDPMAALRRAGEDGRAKPQGVDRMSLRTEAHAILIAAALAEPTSRSLNLRSAWRMRRVG